VTARLLDRCDRYRAMLDEKLASLPDDAARRAFCDREFDRWQGLYAEFVNGFKDYGPEVQAADFLLTICDIGTRQIKYGSALVKVPA
jgi:hypothetical protein